MRLFGLRRERDIQLRDPTVCHCRDAELIACCEVDWDGVPYVGTTRVLVPHKDAEYRELLYGVEEVLFLGVRPPFTEVTRQVVVKEEDGGHGRGKGRYPCAYSSSWIDVTE